MRGVMPMDFYQRILTLADMEDTPENRLKVDAAFEWANMYCRRNFTHDDAPFGFLQGVAVLAKSAKNPPNVTSETIVGGMSVTYNGDATSAAKSHLKPYRKVVFR